MADISKEQAVQLARKAGFSFVGNDAAYGDVVQTLVQAAYKLGRNAGLEEAKGVCLGELNDIHSSNESRNTAEHLADAIESLKDNTP